MATFIYPPTNVTITGGATEATLELINNKLPGPLGQHTMAASFSVAIASDQSPLPITITPNVQDFGPSTNAERVAALLGNPTGLASFGAGTTSAQTLRTVIVTDQSTLNVGVVGIGADFGASAQSFRVAALLGNPTGLASFGSGTTSAQTLRVIPATDSNLAKAAQLPTTLGQTTMAGSTSVAIASDQSAIPVTFTPNVTDFGVTTNAQRTASIIGNTTGQAAFGAGTTSAQTLRIIEAIDSNLAKAAQLPAALGQTTMSGSTSVTIASDQSTIPVGVAGIGADFGASAQAFRVAALLGNPTGLASFGAGTTSAQTLRIIEATDSNLTKAAQLPTTIGQTVMTGSLSVVIASDQSMVNVALPGIGVNYGNSNVALRTASQLGNATGVADFGSGTTSAQTVRVIPAMDSNLAKAAQLPTTLGQTTAANSLSVAIASDQVPLNTNSRARYSRVQTPVLLDAGNIAASGGTRFLVATAAAEITRLFLRDATGLFINWYSASTAGTLLFQTGPGIEVPLDIVIANGTTLYVESATSTAGTSGAFMSINFLS